LNFTEFRAPLSRSSGNADWRIFHQAMNKPNYLYGIIGLLVGLLIGYIGTDSINKAHTPAGGENTPAVNSLPPDHPPTGAQASGAQAGANAPDSGQGGPDQHGGQGPQSDVMAVIQQAKSEPGNFEAQMQAADLFIQIKRPEGALEYYQRAYKTRPNDRKLLVALGDTNFDLSRYEEAERWYQLALKQNPKDATVQLDLGSSYYLRSPKDLDRAIAAYREALKVDPRHEKALQNLTQALIDKGDKSAAAESLKRFEQISSDPKIVEQFRSQLQK
jgi:Flp pilus assembly protein TadD